jgi:hypothetical protein
MHAISLLTLKCNLHGGGRIRRLSGKHIHMPCIACDHIVAVRPRFPECMSASNLIGLVDHRPATGLAGSTASS